MRVRVCGLVRAACLRVMPPCHETLAFVVAVEFGSFAVGPFHFGSGGRLPCLLGFVVRPQLEILYRTTLLMPLL